MSHPTILVAIGLLGFTTLCSAQPAPGAKPEFISPLGVKHYAKADDKGAIAKAETELTADPTNIERLLALGRAQAGAWRFNDAIETYTRAIAIAPNDARLYRQRGHRYISIRRFDDAVRDLTRASHLNDSAFDIWYHLGLAYFLRGEFAEARTAYEKCHEVARKAQAAAGDKDGRDDSLIAVSDWLYMTYRRLDKPADAARILEKITPESKVKENQSYLKRLMFYRGLKSQDELLKAVESSDSEFATVGYGIANWHLSNGDRAKAEEILRRIVARNAWPSFGFIAAEVDLSRPAKK